MTAPTAPAAAGLAAALRGRLIVSCQAPPGSPLRDTGTMVRMARAAVAEGGAAAIRANGTDDIAAITAALPGTPVVGLWKDGDSGVRITPTVRHALAVADAGAAVVAADATARTRPDGATFAELTAAVHAAGALVMADVSTLDEGIAAADDGADLISTTLAGYLPGQDRTDGPDLDLVAALADAVDRPLVAEGRVRTPEEAAAALRHGAHCVVVGTAITAPGAIAARFSAALPGGTPH